MKSHKFCVEDAEKYGVYKAILLEHLTFHQQANSCNQDMIIDGKPHAFISPETIEKMYPYMSYPSVRRWLNELEDNGVLISCKPKAKNGHHLKYYHVVISNDQNDQSNDQNNQSMNDQNDQSSINNHSVLPSVRVLPFLEELERFKEHRMQKRKPMTLYEIEETIQYLRGVKDPSGLIKHCIRNGYVTIDEKYLKKEPAKAGGDNAKWWEQ